MFARVVHADWSKNPGGRWCAAAERAGGAWRASGARPVGDLGAFVRGLLDRAETVPVLAAFDFPIGLPARYGAATGFAGFEAALAGLGGPGWERWYEPAAVPAEVSPRRPFYPARVGAARRAHLLDGLGAARLDDLLRRCERGGPGRPGAGSMFWLVGAKSVGKAAIHGWREVVVPARTAGARLWPFDGPLADLAREPGLVIAESYPADALRQLGLRVAGKGDPKKIAAASEGLIAAAARNGVRLDDDLAADLRTGFADRRGRCGDAFDAVVGLVAALAVCDGLRSDGAPGDAATRLWEGWILGREA